MITEILIFILMLTSLMSTLVCQECSDEWLPEYNDDQEVFVCPNTDYPVGEHLYICGRSEYRDPLTTEIIDKQNGRLKFTYNLHKSNYSALYVTLFVNENADNEENCFQNHVSEDGSTGFKIHSKKYIYLTWQNNSQNYPINNCQSNVSVIFDYIFSGCYSILFRGGFFINDKEVIENIYSCRRMMETNYEKATLIGESNAPRIAPEFVLEGGIVSLTVTKLGGLLKSQFSQIKLLNEVNGSYSMCIACNITGGKIGCGKSDIVKEASFITLPDKNGMNQTRIQWILKEAKEGNYTVKFQYVDIRCNTFDDTVWIKNISAQKICKYSQLIHKMTEYKLETSQVQKEPKNPSSPLILVWVYVLLIVFTTVMIVLVFVILHKWKKIKKESLNYKLNDIRPSDPKDSLIIKSLDDINEIQVLLLYPRDHGLFMNVMIQFQNILKRAKCKVFDYWDVNQYNDVIQDPQSWLHSKIRDKNIQVIIIKSDCSRQLQRNRQESRQIWYYPPEEFDNLFVFGLRCLDHRLFDYQNQSMFIVSLSSQTDDQNLIYLDTLKMRYILPVHLELLLLSLHRIDPSVYRIDMNTPDVIGFKEAFNEYIQFSTRNPNYLDDILKYE
ncbi:uncharacterized protein LOC142327060 [Lycorma delicatula]|uniref:uncharacterized protein LOC142327060 n=1 Tax=Lycorma delicatula TaxID=130591 RepID=UPI003F512384